MRHTTRDKRQGTELVDRRSSFVNRWTMDNGRWTKGFTFVEVLIALSVLGITVGPLMQLYAAALEQVTYSDDLRTALDLAREEVEKVKNLALTERQIKQLGNLVSPPIWLNRKVWYAVRVVDPEATPLEVQVFVYQGKLTGRPLVSLSTILNK